MRRGIGIKKDGKPVEDLVGCADCHGNDHQKLEMPTYKLCNDCHPKETAEHRAGGLGSHTHAYTVNVLEFSWHVGNLQKRLLAVRIVMLLRKTGVPAATQGTNLTRLRPENQQLAGFVIWV